MSLTNEQRAHDLAIASLPFAKSIIDQRIQNGEDIVFDVYLEYKKLYEASLEAMTEDFK
ncbi:MULTISPECIES: hypothetical protein [Enterococcus]|uniref:hypothetical protein n=1 Tax=Enterococcus TaxID=1350 RepID=UPI0015E431E8|nr:hypothetical protein [Enterococcus faecalis]EHM3078025.1 hypothetical protein [Enterococcus faecalis]EJB2752897.1 hypothetical protein [Enterococcus faecalis]EKE4891574.1 hypothetical protein [Enterococcus faecalis]EKZ0433584.1 hypothetical protein [Enterococcus faecalis]MCU9782016.1 hypothetical protein [Enterococcus faecalis]